MSSLAGPARAAAGAEPGPTQTLVEWNTYGSAKSRFYSDSLMLTVSSSDGGLVLWTPMVYKPAPALCGCIHDFSSFHQKVFQVRGGSDTAEPRVGVSGKVEIWLTVVRSHRLRPGFNSGTRD